MREIDTYGRDSYIDIYGRDSYMYIIDIYGRHSYINIYSFANIYNYLQLISCRSPNVRFSFQIILNSVIKIIVYKLCILFKYFNSFNYLLSIFLGCVRQACSVVYVILILFSCIFVCV